MKNNEEISVTRVFLNPIKNRVSVKSVHLEAVYLEVLLYIHFYASLTTEFDNPELECEKFTQNFWKFILTDLVFYGVEIDASLSSGCGSWSLV